ncbi:hypothetical protein N658DRAFT_326922 [Parathielavia hyrcaniae]|uniref:Uncharacterized protein n=1 Tax=Parathielavia hyrcaniae TaxID=113614 RepID=A0AAN6Q4T9_9PEZI|nr:hypothetical protein N658DRAFT_326922 [Parathielavia hyrcaniae]
MDFLLYGYCHCKHRLRDFLCRFLGSGWFLTYDNKQRKRKHIPGPMCLMFDGGGRGVFGPFPFCSFRSLAFRDRDQACKQAIEGRHIWVYILQGSSSWSSCRCGSLAFRRCWISRWARNGRFFFVLLTPRPLTVELLKLSASDPHLCGFLLLL